MKKKLFSVLLAMIMLLTVIQPLFSAVAASSVWTGGTAVPTLSGGYYQINTAEKLAWFAAQVNNGSSSIKAKLTDDIMLNSVGSYLREWIPIGSAAKPFKGEFDGNGHYISGVSIKNAVDNCGLFGYIATEKPVIDDEDDTSEEIFVPTPPTVIHDLEVKNSNIAGLENTGGVCGYISYGIIKNCSYNGTVTSTSNSVGGVAGHAISFSRVMQCFSKGSVTGNLRTGGILGYGEANTQVNECYSTAIVKSQAVNIGRSGGIVGALSASSLKGCYFMGKISGPKAIGGIVGFVSYSKVISCYVIGLVSSTIDAIDDVGAIAGYSLGGEYLNCYYCKDSTIVGDTRAVARTLAEMKKFSFVRELNENANAFSYDYMVINDGFPVLVFMLETSVWAGGVEQPDKDSAGWYLIRTPDNLAWFAGLVNGTLAGVERNSAAKARLMDNLLLNIFITDDTTLTNIWKPIGTQSYPFTGTFNGNGYNIAGVYVDGTKNQGLFGYIGTGGVVQNVVMMDGLIKGTENVGAVAGYNAGKISLSCNDGEVNGQKYIGGIAGYNVGTVETSYNVGTVKCTYSGGASVGGIVGYNTRATVSQCFNNGLVTGVANSNYYGGVVGFNSGDGVNNCYNSGEVLGGFYVGGVVGYNSTGTVKYSLNYGVVNSLNSTNSNTNNFIGYNYGTCTITNCYYDSTIENTTYNNGNGANPKKTEELTGSSASYNLGLQSGKWSNKYDDDYYRYYPQFYMLYYSGYSKVRDDSLESVRVVKDTYNVKLKIDGANDTFFSDIQSAVTSLENRTGTIVPIRNLTVNSTVNIPNTVTIHGEGFKKYVTKGAELEGPMFNVTGTLTLGDIKDGSDENVLLVLDGYGITSDSALISVTGRGKVNLNAGVSIVNNSSTDMGSAFYVDSDATLNVKGGIIRNNTTTSDGGAVYNDMGNVNISGGYIIGNQSSVARGGAIYNNSGIVNISGGEISENYGKTYGGAIYSIGTDAEVTISNDALIKGNYANAGGGIFINAGTVTMTGGTICENFAYKKHGSTATTGGGGGVSINSNGIFQMTGGTICHNYVYNNVGAGFGVADFGTFQMSGDALITENDVLVAKNRSINLTDKLNAAGTVAVITPANYTTSTVVLSGEKVGVNYTKFQITPQSGTPWYVNSIGVLMNTAVVNVASLSKFGAYAVDYVSVAQAVKEVKAGESGIITIIADNTINETVKVYGDVTILSETDSTYTSMRSGTFTGTLFEVQPGGTLRLGFTEAKTWGEDVSEDGEDFFTLDSVGGKYILDGGYAYNQAQGTSLITVKAGGTLYTYNDFQMQNGCAKTGGNIDVSGTMFMYGGEFVNNIGVNGGAINIASTGKVALLGGRILSNTVKDGGLGKAIYNAGTLVRAENVYEYTQDEEVVSTKNTFTTVADNNDVYLSTGKTVELDKVTTTVLLSSSDDAPETVKVSAPKMILTSSFYYAGMPVISGKDVGIHYTEFGIGDDGYYVLPDGTIGYNRLIATNNSGLKIDRKDNLISGFDTSLTVADYTSQFLNTEKIEIRNAEGNVIADDGHITTGSTISLYNESETEIIDMATVVIIGDVDCDGFIDGMDAVYISAIAQGLFANGGLTPAQFRAADIDGSGAGDETDAQYIQSCGLKINTVDQSV
ncbi:MAG: hypothetical protein MJ147_08450 [Clostridia bacterium]|nr:hypothetical protein [Clostridia bacterium]